MAFGVNWVKTATITRRRDATELGRPRTSINYTILVFAMQTSVGYGRKRSCIALHAISRRPRRCTFTTAQQCMPLHPSSKPYAISSNRQGPFLAPSTQASLPARLLLSYELSGAGSCVGGRSSRSRQKGRLGEEGVTAGLQLASQSSANHSPRLRTLVVNQYALAC